ncbi:MAG: hypothetical protein RLZZ172_1122 [Bacteroidota bacterium]|jgi:hypothetical protein
MHNLKALLFFLFFSQYCFSQSIPKWDPALEQPNVKDWLVHAPTQKAGVYSSQDGKDIILYNGLVKRTFRISPNLTCFDFRNLSSGQQLLRAVRPEAVVTINGLQYAVGGLTGQKEKAYLMPSWIDGFKSGETDFQYAGVEVTDITPFINWKRRTWAYNTAQPKGKLIKFRFNSSLAHLKGVEVEVNYELYNGLPLIVKWVTVKNNSTNSITINRIINETLGLVEEESAVVGSPDQMKKQHGLYVETNYAFNNAMRYDISDQTTHWKIDSTYTSQVNYNYQTPCVLEVYPEKVLAVDLLPGEVMKSPRTHELLMDSYDRERRGLMIQQMYATVAPWTTSNPIFMHLVSKDDDQVRTAVDQCVATGYEALILSFGSHCNMEDTAVLNVAKWKALADYAHSKGILIGSYSLFSSRRINDETDVIDPKTGKPGGAFFGNAPCMGSAWGLNYLDRLKYFMTATGFDLFENDGPYPGDVCASTVHPGHKGLEDSQWRQMELQKGLYRWCNENGIYVNAPDWYFLDGTHKIAVGYREVNFSLSREQQMILNRQNIHDGTKEKLPSMGWGFVPLTRYQGGGPEAVLEPLKDHLKEYEQLMVQYYGAGVQACYRGPRLYDTDSTRKLVTNTVAWYKKYRDILNAPMVHLRRADGRDWDGWMHVSPTLKDRAFVLLFNPTNEVLKRIIRLPLYYTGLKDVALVRLKDKQELMVRPGHDRTIELTVNIPPGGYTWYVIR